MLKDALTTQFPLIQMVLVYIGLTIAGMFFIYWRRERQLERKFREEQVKREEKRFQEQQKAEKERLDREYELREREHYSRVEEAQSNERVAQAAGAGNGSGGYIVIDMEEDQRPLFHDLLKGFEDYAQLKGYHLSFSIDSSFEGRIAFKFTIKNEGIIVGAERVRKDFSEYLEHIREGHVDDFDSLPVITSLEEHTLLVTLLKNRISFLKHSYTLSQNAVAYYESVLAQAHSFPALPTQSIIVHTGGSMDSRKYNAVNSSRLNQGEGNTYADSSSNITIGSSFNEKHDRILKLEKLITRLEDAGNNESARKAGRELSKVKDELSDEAEPDTSRIARWMNNAKSLLTTAEVGVEVVDAAHQLFQSFGMG